MSLEIKKRGRPSKADIAARTSTPAPARTDAEILEDLNKRFHILSVLTKGTMSGNIPAVVVTGAPGVGKSYTVERDLVASDTSHEVVTGSMSAVNLYKLGYKYRRPGSVLVLDDVDTIFNDEQALNLLKAMCDSSSTRRVSWLKESPALTEDDIPRSYEFEGSVIFISNLDFQKFVDDGKNKYAPHMEALMSRSMYLDLRLHDRNALGVWVEHIATSAKIFERENVPSHLVSSILQFLTEYRGNLRELSIRTLLKLCQLSKSNPDDWQDMATVLLTRGY